MFHAPNERVEKEGTFATEIQALLDSDRDNEGGCFNTGLGERPALTKAERQAERSAHIRAKYPEFFSEVSDE